MTSLAFPHHHRAADMDPELPLQHHHHSTDPPHHFLHSITVRTRRYRQRISGLHHQRLYNTAPTIHGRSPQFHPIIKAMALERHHQRRLSGVLQVLGSDPIHHLRLLLHHTDMLRAKAQWTSAVAVLLMAVEWSRTALTNLTPHQDTTPTCPTGVVVCRDKTLRLHITLLFPRTSRICTKRHAAPLRAILPQQVVR